MPKLDIVLDATMEDTFLTCEQKYYLRFIRNKSTDIKAAPLDRGDLVHIGLENYYDKLKGGYHMDDCIEQMLLTVNIRSLESELPHEKITFLKQVLIENVHFWREEDKRLEILEIETPFAYTLFEDDYIRFIMIGKIDLLTNDRRHDYFNLPYDHKSYDRDYPINQISNQFTNYSYATRSGYLVVNRIGMQKTLKPAEKYKRELLSFSRQQYDKWVKNQRILAYRYLFSASENEWPMNTTSCDKFNRICEYQQLCREGDPDAFTYKLHTNFKNIPPWDVSKSLGGSASSKIKKG